MGKYINLNARIGMNEEYKDPRQVMEEMDRLGVYTTVMEYTTGSNARYLNEKLLELIRDLPRERVIPGYFLGMQTVFETGGMEALRKMLEERPGCIVLYPKDSQYRLKAIAMALDQLKELPLVVMMDATQVRNDGGADDLVYLARRYPNMSFVIRRIMYPSMPFMADAMYRAENIYAECSWFHTRNAIGMFSRLFGAQRILFSLGKRGNGGAAMAAVTFSDIPEAEKELVRWGNFARIFGDVTVKDIPNRVANSFWTPFVEQGIVPDVPIYDVHTHMGPTGSNWFLENCNFQTQIPGFEADMEKFHVRKIVSSCSGRPDLIQANREMEAAVGQKTDRFKGYLRFDPRIGKDYTEEYVQELLDRAYFVGLKTLPQYMDTDIRDESYEPMFRWANARKLPVLIHCWGDGLGSPFKCAEAAAKWPDAKVILGHSGGNDIGKAQSEIVAQDPKFANVYFEFCGSFPAASSWKETLEKIDYKRVLFGTDACLHDYGWEMGRLLSEDIDDEILTAILGGNAKELFGFQD